MDARTEALDEFGAILMRRVRDEAITDWDMILDGRMKSANAERIRQMLAALDPDDLAVLHAVIPRVVDTTLHHLLWTLEQLKHVRIAVETEAGPVPDLARVSDGLPGEVFGDEGWVARFSKERSYSLLE